MTKKQDAADAKIARKRIAEVRVHPDRLIHAAARAPLPNFIVFLDRTGACIRLAADEVRAWLPDPNGDGGAELQMKNGAHHLLLTTCEEIDAQMAVNVPRVARKKSAR